MSCKDRFPFSCIYTLLKDLISIDPSKIPVSYSGILEAYSRQKFKQFTKNILTHEVHLGSIKCVHHLKNSKTEREVI